jgi:two-component sensor histidine kinase
MNALQALNSVANQQAEAAVNVRAEARGAASEARLASVAPAGSQAAQQGAVQSRPAAYGVAGKPTTAEARTTYDTQGKISRSRDDGGRGQRVDRNV